MKHLRNPFLLWTLLILAAFLFAVPAVFAQDTAVTQEAPAATVEAPLDTEQPPVIPANNTGSILLVVAAILAIVAGGGSILSMLEHFRQNKAAVQATEALGDSVPRPIAEKLIDVIQILAAGGAIAIEALDGVPAASKPTAQSKTLPLDLRYPADGEDR